MTRVSMPRLAMSRLPGVAALGLAATLLASCSFLADDMETLPAQGSAFSQALASNYAELAAQGAALPAPEEDTGFFSGLFGSSDTPGDLLAAAFEAKSQLAAGGDEPAPEASPNANVESIRQRLTRAVTAGKTQFPDQAARAQADFDCWVLFGTAPGGTDQAATCKSRLDSSLVALETAIQPPAPPPPPPPAPVTSAPVAPVAATEFTVLFDFDSWTLTAENLTVLTQAINTARAGGQSRIQVVGHTDTSGAAEYNQGLSVRRANVVVEALVEMGARREAITASGVGETDLAVATEDGVREARNRRTVIGLQP